MEGIRKAEHTSEGEVIRFGPSSAMRFRYTVTAVIRIAIVIGLGYWTYPSLEAYFVAGQITGPVKLLQDVGIEEPWLRRVLIGWCIVLTWWALGSLFEIIQMLLRGDLFVLRHDGFTVQRRSILSREFRFTSYDPLELRLRALDGALEAKQRERTTVLTDGGTTEDRQWLLEKLQQRYKFPEVTSGTKTVESVATYTVKIRPDRSVLIHSSKGSQAGCASLGIAACIGLIALAIYLFSNANPAGLIALMICAAIAYGTMTALNRRTIEAAPGKLFLRWSSPAGKILGRFISMENSMLKHQFGEGETKRESGALSLKTVRGSKGSISYHLVLRNGVPERWLVPDKEMSEAEEERLAQEFDEYQRKVEELDPENLDEEDLADPFIEEDFLLSFTGAESRPAAEYILKLLSDTTGFQAIRYLNPN